MLQRSHCQHSGERTQTAASNEWPASVPGQASFKSLPQLQPFHLRTYQDAPHHLLPLVPVENHDGDSLTPAAHEQTAAAVPLHQPGACAVEQGAVTHSPCALRSDRLIAQQPPSTLCPSSREQKTLEWNVFCLSKNKKLTALSPNQPQF